MTSRDAASSGSILTTFPGRSQSDMLGTHERFGSLRFVDGMGSPPQATSYTDSTTPTSGDRLPTYDPGYDTVYQSTNQGKLESRTASTCQHLEPISFTTYDGTQTALFAGTTLIPGGATKPLIANGLICLLTNDIKFAIVTPPDSGGKRWHTFWDPRATVPDLATPLTDVAAAPNGGVLYGVGARGQKGGFAAALTLDTLENDPENSRSPGPIYPLDDIPGGVTCSPDGKYVIAIAANGRSATVINIGLQPSLRTIPLDTSGDYDTSGRCQIIDSTTCYVLLTHIDTHGGNYRSAIWKTNLTDATAHESTSDAPKQSKTSDCTTTRHCGPAAGSPPREPKPTSTYKQALYAINSPQTIYPTGTTASQPSASSTFALRAIVWT
jgi:hypothetical protein